VAILENGKSGKCVKNGLNKKKLPSLFFKLIGRQTKRIGEEWHAYQKAYRIKKL